MKIVMWMIIGLCKIGSRRQVSELWVWLRSYHMEVCCLGLYFWIIAGKFGERTRRLGLARLLVGASAHWKLSWLLIHLLAQQHGATKDYSMGSGSNTGWCGCLGQIQWMRARLVKGKSWFAKRQVGHDHRNLRIEVIKMLNPISPC